MTYEELGIDPNKLKRDYLKNPLKRISNPTGNFHYEKPNKEDLSYLLIDKKIKLDTLALLFKVEKHLISKWRKNFNINRHPNTLTNAFYNTYSIDKRRLKRDYIAYPLKRNANQLKETPYKEDIQYLYLDLNLQRDIILTYFNISKNMLDKWTKRFALHKDYQKRRINIEKTNIMRYGVKNPAVLPNIRCKAQKTLLKHYGVKNPSKSKIIINKIYTIRKNNNSLNGSNIEKTIYKKLCEKFKDVKYQYKSEEYPFNCDFYIPELKLYIEYQGCWTHGKYSRKVYGPYDKNKADHKELLNMWKERSKTNNFYKQAIDVWTRRDPLKRETAEKNNLNWIEFFTMSEFEEWFKQF